MDEKTIAFFRFIDLRVYDKALDYSKWVVTQVQQPRNDGERYLFNSFFKSANDIALNIAEGSSRSNMQFEHYLKTSKSAIRECITYTELCYKLGSLGDKEREQSHELLMELMRMIGALIVSLGRPRRHYEEHDDRGGDHYDNDADNDRGGRNDRYNRDDNDDRNSRDSRDDRYNNGDDDYHRNDNNGLSF
jgi:four helix bundle protein